ncbi:MAG: fibronectin type III domain-containing protein [Candidatus Dojkabacteria bacterium]|jgi:hypothetical protein|nr:fibronectin type III domain-containing protein [Candidatus Dojkabacteria bacterium]
MLKELPLNKIKWTARIFLVSSFFVLLSIASSYAQTKEVSSIEDWNSGTFSNINLTQEGLGIELEADGSWNALMWRTPDKTISAGAAFTSDGTHVYVIRGLGDNLFWRYTPSTDSWENLRNLPYGVYLGSDLQYLNGYVYAIFGGYQKKFARYSIAEDSWEVLEDYPELVYQGASMTTDGTSIYSIAANNTQNFYKYTVETDSWGLLASTPATTRGGADLERVGDFIYTPRGVNTTTFYRYQISTNTWSTLANLPATMNDDVDITNANGYIYVARQNNTANFYKYEIATNTWSVLPDAPLTSRYAGVQYVSSEGYILFFRGNGDNRLWKFDINTDTFIGPVDPPSTLSTGSDMVFYNGDLYVLRGANSTTFYKYTVATNTWDTLANSPASFNDDVRGFTAGAYIYFLRGSNNNNFYRYNVASNTWETLATSPANSRYGSAIAYPGSGNYIYVTRGATTSDFWRYDTTTDTWDTSIANLPTGIVASYGSTLLSDGTDIFFTAGIGVKRMFKYTILTDSWEEISPLPFSPYYGTDTTYDGNGHILALAGNYKTDLWEYSISGNSWRKLGAFSPLGPTEIGNWTGASVVTDNSGTIYVSRGGARPEILTYTRNIDDYKNSGIWYSPIYNLEYVDSWTSISVTEVLAGDSATIIETRGSEDGVTWGNWTEISGGNIASEERKFLQIRVTLISSSDGSQTPTVEEISIEYASDINPPSSVTGGQGFSQEVAGVELEETEEYTFLNPMFTWEESTDSETSVLGYYVYFGSNASANPVDDGAFQTSNSYTVNKAIDVGTNYLRIVAEDILGNRSNASLVFTYIYQGVGPYLSLEVDNENLDGTLEEVQGVDDGIKLENISGGFWLQERLALPLTNLGYGAKNIAYISDSNKLFIPSGMNNRFFSYSITDNVWTELATAPNTIYYGGGVVGGPDGYIYAMRGNNSTDFWRYSIANNTWETSISSVPLTVGYGGSMVFDGKQYIYVLRGNNSDFFWRYDTFSDTWESLRKVDFGAPVDNVNNNVYTDGSLAIDRVNQLIYATQGNYLSGFSVYDINTDTWTILPSTPMLPNQGSSITYYAKTNSIYYTNGNYTPNVFRYDIDVQEWYEISSVPTDFRYGGGIHNVGDDLFAIRGGNTNGFYRYDIEKDSWSVPKTGIFGREFEGSTLFNTYYGSDILRGDGNNFYMMRGYYGDQFIRWNEQTGQTTRLANLPVGSYQGGSMGYDSVNNKIYLTGGVYDRGFFVYDIESNTWTEESDDKLLLAASNGSSMAYDGSQYMYLNRGGGTNTFYRYDTQGDAGSRWSSMTNIASTVSYGSELLLKEGYIYTLRGYNSNPNPFYRYDLSLNQWDNSLTSLPSNVSYESFLADGNDGNFYAIRGGNTSEFYKYSLSGDTWTRLPDFPGQINVGGAGESNMRNSIYVVSGNGTSTYSDALYTYIIESEDSGFVQEGEYISEVHDLTSVYRWGDIYVEADIETNSNISVETSTSQDSIEWNDWTPVSRERIVEGGYMYKINSPAFRYLKIRFTLLSGDGINTPLLSGYKINYYQDLLAPSNPESAGLQTFSEQGGESISSDTWYNHSNPYFEWAEDEEVLGATDGVNGSGVSGYYVYWGEESDAIPSEDGVLQDTNTFSPIDLVDSTTYYLRVQSVDNAGNTSEEVWQPFIYKYDSSPPGEVQSLSADPGGYTSNNNFTFNWEDAITEGSPIEEYCYITGVGQEQSEEICIEDTAISDIVAYKVGTNMFKVRAKDAAGNFGEYSSVQYFYVDSENAPAPPTNLQVTPQNSTANSFGFSWDPPLVGTYYGSQSNLSYLYSVNALPTEHSTSQTSLRYLNPGAYATLPGENVFYIVCKDEAGNVNYNDYTSVSFFANTVAPGIPINVEIADVSVKSKSSWRLAVSWDEPDDQGSGVAGYQIYRSIDGENFFMHSFTSGSSLVDSKLIQMTYYYKIKACDSTNNCGAMSEVVSLYPDGRYIEPAELIVEPIISGVTPKKASVSWITARTADSRVAYGTKPGEYFEEEVSNSDQVVDHVLTINNLSPGTQYYYVVKWTDEDGNIGISEEDTFTTSPPPTIQEPVVRSISLNSALIEFTTKDAVKVRILYGETPAFGGMKEVYTGSQEGTHNVELVDIKDGTKYFYKINTFDIDGSEYEGEMHSFETLPRPKIVEPKVYQVSGTASATLLVEWSSNTPVSSVVTYYPTSSPEKALDEVNVALKGGTHRMVLLNLLPNTPYSIIVSGRDFMGNEASSNILSFTTAVDTRPPQIYDLEVSSEVLGSGQEATAQLVISYKTDEPATSQVEYGEGTGTTYAQKSQEDTVLSINHIVIISGLTPSKVYHLRALSNDKEGNTGYSIDKVVVTNPSTEAAFNLAINNLVSIFSFLGRN